MSRESEHLELREREGGREGRKERDVSPSVKDPTLWVWVMSSLETWLKICALALSPDNMNSLGTAALLSGMISTWRETPSTCLVHIHARDKGSP